MCGLSAATQQSSRDFRSSSGRVRDTPPADGARCQPTRSPMTSRTRPAVLVLLVLQLGFVLAAKIATPPADARVELDAADIAARAAPPSAKAPRSVFAKPGRPRVKLPGLLTNAGGLLKSPFALIATFRGPIGVMLARLRLTAFTSEVGESLRPVIPGWQVACAYGVSWLYVFIDVAVRGAEQWASAPGDPARLTRLVAYSSLFHTVATMLIPAVLIHAAVHGVQHLVQRYAVRRGLLALVATWLPTLWASRSSPRCCCSTTRWRCCSTSSSRRSGPFTQPQPRDEPHAPGARRRGSRAVTRGMGAPVGEQVSHHIIQHLFIITAVCAPFAHSGSASGPPPPSPIRSPPSPTSRCHAMP